MLVGHSKFSKTGSFRPISSYISCIIFGEKDLAKAPEEEMMDIRGKDIAMIFQDVGNALDPIMQIRKQYEEAILVHQKMDKKACGEVP